MHADEADSALPAIKGMVSPQVYATIQRLAAWPRKNPGEGLGEGSLRQTEDKGDDAIGFAQLIPLAQLVTGQWGQLPAKQKALYQMPIAQSIGERAKGRQPFRLPIANPSSSGEVKTGDWSAEPMFERLRALREELILVEERANARYERLGVPEGEKRGWVNAMRQCRADVEWVLDQEEAAGRGEARVVERDGFGNVVRVMGIDPSKSKSTAWQFKRKEEQAKSSRLRKTRSNPSSKVPEGERKPWGIVAAKGNQKLPFASYSTLPMSTCPGAGSCAVELKREYDNEAAEKAKDESRSRLVKDGYCYSFTAWRYPASFSRQFRNCLAEFADREFAIIEGARLQGRPVPLNTDMVARVELALVGRGVRSWHELCREFVVRDLVDNVKPAERDGKPAFLRLYVDGDINTEDNVFEWMNVCAQLQSTRLTDDRGIVRHPGIQVYGYSKCWDQFLLLDRRDVKWPSFVQTQTSEGLGVDPQGGKFLWPSNYTLNMSADSRWNYDKRGEPSSAAEEALRRITVAMAALPVARGYFRSIDLRKSISGLSEQFEAGNLAEFPTPPADGIPFPFNRERMLAVLTMNAGMNPEGATIQSLEEAYRSLVAKYGLEGFVPTKKLKSGPALKIEKVKPIFTAGLKKGRAKEPQRIIDETSENLLSNLYRGWFHKLYVHGVGSRRGGGEMTDYAASFPGQQTQAFASIVLRELSLDEVTAGQEPLSPLEFVEEDRAEKMAAKVGDFLKKMATGDISKASPRVRALLERMGAKGRSSKEQRATSTEAKTLAQSFVYADKKADEIKAKVREFPAIVNALLDEGFTQKDVTAFIKGFDPEVFIDKFGMTDAYQKKALAVALHEVLWTSGVGGSCPLICGNCYDSPTAPKKGTDEYIFARHRCASREGFHWKTINIGRH